MTVQYILAGDIDLPLAVKIRELIRPQSHIFPGPSNAEDTFADASEENLVIECQLWAGPHNLDQCKEAPYSTHWVTTKSFSEWKYSTIPYSQLALNCTHPERPRKANSLARQIREYLLYERSLGPHIWIEVRSPSQTIRPKEQFGNVLAVGALSLVSYFHTIGKMKQGTQSVKLFPLLQRDQETKKYSFVPIEQDQLIEHNIRALNQVSHMKGNWINQVSKHKLQSLTYASPSFCANSPQNQGSFVPDAILGHLIIKLPTFHTENLFINFTPPKLVYSESTNLPFQSQPARKGNLTNSERVPLRNVVQINDYALHPLKGRSEEPTEEKYRKLSWNAQPPFEVKQVIDEIVNLPPTELLNDEQKTLLWNYRNYLSADGRALKKFLQAINWNKDPQRKEALRLMRKWKDVPPLDGLELLAISPQTPPQVFLKAIELLDQIPDLRLFLLELMQMLRQDVEFQRIRAETPKLHDYPAFPLFELLKKRAYQNFELCNDFYWYLASESTGANSQIFKSFFSRFKMSLEEPDNPNGKSWLEIFKTQRLFINAISRIYNDPQFKAAPGSEGKATYVRKELPKVRIPSGGIPLPLKPSVIVVGFIIEKCIVFKSNAQPLKLVMQTLDGNTFSMIFKKGDDLRQDMFFLQMLQFFDGFLRSENFDLHLTPYRILPTQRDEGLVEFVPDSKTTADIPSIQEYFRGHHLDPNAPYKISPSVMEVFMRSCAGYCVVTFILGVGDRHHHNMMIKSSGNFFHIDFGYIFGAEPNAVKKWTSPPFLLSQSMVDCMGGMDSDHFKKFCEYCCEAFIRVRSEANVILNLTSLLIEANINNIDDGIHTIRRLEKNFRLKSTDEELACFFVDQIYKCAGWRMTMITNMVHDLNINYQ